MSLPPATGAVELASFKQHILRLLAQKKRLDERSFNDIRTPRILHDDWRSEKASGVLASTLYTDDTGACVNCTVSGVFGPPPHQHPEEGRLLVTVTAPFFPSYSTGQIEGALCEVARFVRSTIVACLDLSELSVISGEACWVLRVELIVINADGGLWAAALHTAVAALRDLTLPRARLPNGDVVESKRLRFHSIPVTVTIAVCSVAGNIHLLVDPNAAEESVADGLLTAVLDDAGGIVTLLHQGRVPLLASFIVNVIDMLASHSATLRSAILNSHIPSAVE